MKIAFVTQDMVGQGVQYATAIIARAFANKGWDVDILVSPVNDDLIRQGGKMFELPSNVRLLMMPSRHGSRNGWYLRRYLLHGGADIILAESGIYSWCIVWASFGISKKRLPRLAQVDHGNTYLKCGFDLLTAKIENWYHYRKYSTLMFVNSKSAENFRHMSIALNKLKVAVVNNACVDEVFLSKIAMPPKHPWLRNKECPTFVVAGSYTPIKCHLVLMDAFKLVVAKKKARLVVFGRGPLQQEYEKFVFENGLKNEISIAGYTSNLPAEIQASDCLISSSKSESFGITIAEALACNKPVISTDAPLGPREILSDGRFGKLVPVNDVLAMALAIIDFIDGKGIYPPKDEWKKYTVAAIEKRYFEALDVV